MSEYIFLLWIIQNLTIIDPFLKASLCMLRKISGISSLGRNSNNSATVK